MLAINNLCHLTELLRFIYITKNCSCTFWKKSIKIGHIEQKYFLKLFQWITYTLLLEMFVLLVITKDYYLTKT